MQVDGSTYGIASQGGDSRFTHRFAIVTHGAWDPAASMRFALDHQNPLVAAAVTGGASAPLTAPIWTLLDLPSADVLLWALKPAEEGIAQGLVARVWNVADASRTFNLSLPAHGLTSARRVTHLETDLGAASLASGVLGATLARQQMATFRLFPGTTPALDVIPPAAIRDLSAD
jgi:alpha-mannosidase